MKRVAWIVGLIVLGAGVGVAWWLLSPAGPRPAEAGLRDVVPTRTAIVPTLDTPIPEGKSALWCASFQIAWEHFKKDVTKGPVRLGGADDLARRLNDAPSVADTVREEDVYAKGGFLRDGVIEKIEREMAGRFPGVPVPTLAGPLTEGVAFAYLRASLPFTRRYADHKERLLFRGVDGEGKPVRSFGIPTSLGRRSELFRQIEVLHAADNEPGHGLAFVIDPCRDTYPYQLLLARLPRKATLAEALADMEKRARKGVEPGFDLLRNAYAFWVPHMRFRIAHRFAALEGRDLLNPSTEGLHLARAEQCVDFRLDASGASLASNSILDGAKGEPPELRLNDPFLLVMRQRGEARSFLVLWIENDELLEPW